MQKQIMKDSVQSIVEGMLKENTGEHMLDSGGAYGRDWQRNQKVNFEKTPYFTWSSNKDGTVDYIDKNLYHFLPEHLKVTKESKALAKEWEKFLKLDDNKDTGYLALMEEFAEKQHEEEGSYLGRGTQNTYNDPDNANLSQILQFTYFSKNYLDKATGAKSLKEFILLQIHGGCDARGGYTKPQLFEVDLESFLCAFSVRAMCDSCDGDWSGYEVTNKLTEKGGEFFCAACKKEVQVY